MYDHTFYLLRLLDDRIRRAAILIEQHQIHIAELDASHNDLIQSLERVAEETRKHLRTYPSRQPGRTIAEQKEAHRTASRDLTAPPAGRAKSKERPIFVSD